MEITDSRIDAGKAFDWGKTSEDYARYRDIYPQEFYRKITDRGLCTDGQRVLDLGTGTGVLPRNMYKYGAEWTGTDISPEQIDQAGKLSDAAGMKIRFQAVSTEDMDFPDETFDVKPQFRLAVNILLELPGHRAGSDHDDMLQVISLSTEAVQY